jgi:uncharacterized FlaG/YvyC family protein
VDVSAIASPAITTPNRQNTGKPRSSGRAVTSDHEPSTQKTTQAAHEQQTTTADDAHGDTEKAVRQVNDAFTKKQQNLFAAIEKDQITGIAVFKIMDKKTNEVVRQLPVKEIVSFAQSLEVPQGWRGQLILDKV